MSQTKQPMDLSITLLLLNGHQLSSLSLWPLSHPEKQEVQVQRWGAPWPPVRQGLWPSFEQQVSLSLSIQSHPAAHQLYKEEPARGISIHHHSLKLRDQIWHPQDTQSTVSSHITRTNKGTSTFQWRQPPTVCYYAKNGTRLNKERSRIWKPSPTVLLPIYNSRESEFSK